MTVVERAAVGGVHFFAFRSPTVRHRFVNWFTSLLSSQVRHRFVNWFTFLLSACQS